MPITTVTASDGDTLCGLAINAGFLDCDPLRAEAANAAFLNRDLVAGDVVTVPELQAKQASKGTGATHKFVAKNVPGIAIRLVHGSADKPYRQDDTTTFLNISNYVTNKGGANGQAALPATTRFSAAGHADPDTFKVEVVDPAGPGNVDVLLEAMKPILAADGKTILRHEPFTGADLAARSVTVSCKKVPSGVCYRSAYLRLVVDEADQAAVPAQTLLVTDMADGQNGANDKVEILDQLVRASYVRTKCPAGNKCTARVLVPLAPDKQRIRVAFHLFRATAGAGTTAIGGVTEQLARRRALKWFRRLYAQAGLAPTIVAPFTFLDPPRANMLVISQHHGRAASGIQATGGTSSVSFTLSPPAGAAPFPGPPPGPAGGPTVTVPLLPGMSPSAAGAAVAAAMPAGFTAVAFTNARAFTSPDASCDVMIRRADNLPVIIRGETTTDTLLTVLVPRFNIASVDVNAPAASLIACTPEQRRVVRESPGADDRLDFYVVGSLDDAAGTNVARGIAMVPANELPGPFQAPAPIRWGALMGTVTGGHTLDATDANPFSFPHEAGHVLNDAFHTDNADPNGRTQMMRAGTSGTSVVDGSKRICDVPINVRYDCFDPNPATQAATPGSFTTTAINAVQRMRARAAQVLEPW